MVTSTPSKQLSELEQRRYTRALERLLDLGLVERGRAGGALQVRLHRLVAAAVGDGRREAVATTLLEIWRAHFVLNDTTWAEPHLAHLTHLAEAGLATGDAYGGLLGMELGWHLTLTSRHEPAIAYQQRSLALLMELRVGTTRVPRHAVGSPSPISSSGRCKRRKRTGISSWKSIRPACPPTACHWR